METTLLTCPACATKLEASAAESKLRCPRCKTDVAPDAIQDTVAFETPGLALRFAGE